MPDKPITIGDRLYHQAKRRPEAKALQAPDKKPLSYRGLWQVISEYEQVFSSAGLSRQGRLGVLVPMGREAAVAVFAAACYTTTLPINPGLTVHEIKRLIQRFKLNGILLGRDMAQAPDVYGLARELDLCVFTVNREQSESAGAELARQGGKQEASAADNEKLAFVLPTSGTTAEPKIVPLSRRNIQVSAQNIIHSLELKESDNCLNVMPLHHVHGLLVATAVFFSGGSLICTPEFSRQGFYVWLDKFRPTWYTAAAGIQENVISRASEFKDTISRQKLRLIRSSSAPLAKATTQKLERTFGAPVAESYGMTEAALQITSQPLPPQARKFGSAGKPAGPEVAIVDSQTGGFLAAGEIGEIVIKGENVIQGYEDAPEDNQKSFLDGWLRTGDLGYLDQDGFLFIQGRAKEMINKGGENISPREIDESLSAHPAVEQAVAFAYPHTTLGEDIGMAVVAKPGQSPDESDLKDFMRQQIANFKIPSLFYFTDNIPRTSAGKPKRVGLYEYCKQKQEKTGQEQPPDHIIKGVWEEVLDTKVGLDDNFFEAGGDSIKAREVIARLRKLGYSVSVADLYDFPFPSSLSCLVSKKSNE